MLSKYVYLLIALFASMHLLYINDDMCDIKFNFTTKWLNIIKNIYFNLNRNSSLETSMHISEKVFTPNELKKYTNLKDGLYISILGHVFDVTKGAKHYQPGAPYHIFTGCDASASFITGNFEELTDDISLLPTDSIVLLNKWLKFYHENYIYKGKLNGRYYDEHGVPKEEFQNVLKIISRAKVEQLQEEYIKQMLPPCNIEWDSTFGTVVWCSERSGGIERDWIGVPRMLFESPNSKQYRCACVKLDSKEYKEMKGMLREYSQCPETSIRCFVKAENLSS
ncbi:Cyb5d2 [Anthophora quadrimaculata]